jgi:hypothetical protein
VEQQAVNEQEFYEAVRRRRYGEIKELPHGR